MASEALLLAERSVPRYTSYPTAPQFGPQVGPERYDAWLKHLPASAKLSLYLHVPFCREICLYCGCHTKAVRRQGPIDEYARALQAEIAALGLRLGEQRPVLQVHWGGGTPSILGGDGLLALTDELARHFNLAPLAEHAIELDPRHVHAELVAALACIGIDRVSLGVQDLSPHVQAAIGRIQPYDCVARAVDLLRSRGIERINIDLMYGLPRQTVDDVRSTAHRIVALKPQRVALFGYAHVPWFRKQQRLIDAAELPGAAARLEQMQAAHEMFESAGYVAVGLDHFATPGDALAAAARHGQLHRNFQGYTADAAEALLALGASAIGRLPQGYVQNAPDVGGYMRAVFSGALATVKGIALSPEDRVRGAVIERIMCDLRVDLRAFAEPSLNLDFTDEISALQRFAADGLLAIEGRTLTVTQRGRPFVRLIASVFDAYLAARDGKYSRAV